MIYRIIDRLRENGINLGVVSTGYKAEVLKEYLREYTNREIVVEDEPLDTGGGLRLAAEAIDDDVFVVMNGDIITDAPLREMIEEHENSSADVTILAYTVDDPRHYGVLIVDEDRILGFVEKPKRPPSNLINAGVYIMSRKVIERIPEGRVSLEKEIFPKIVEDMIVRYYKYSGPRFDAGKPETFLKANSRLIERYPTLAISPEAKVYGIVENSSIASGVTIEDGSIVKNAVILENTYIGRGTMIENAIIGREVRIGEGKTFKRLLLADKSVLERSSFFYHPLQ